jgi:hypothetical protein
MSRRRTWGVERIGAARRPGVHILTRLPNPTSAGRSNKCIPRAQAEMRAAGLEAGEIVSAEQAFQQPAYEGYGCFFVSAPDGNVYCIQQAPD